MRSFTIGDLADCVGGVVKGDSTQLISGVATIEQANSHQLTFLSNTKYRKFLATTGAGAVVLAASDLEYCDTNAIVCDNPYLAYAKLAHQLYPDEVVTPSIHPSAVVALSAVVHATASVGPNVVIDEQVVVAEGVMIGAGCHLAEASYIGEYSRLVSRVNIGKNCIIGRRAILHPGVVIGADGFGLAPNAQGEWYKIPQVGAVCLGDDVEIGANSTVDCGAIGNTVLGDGVKIDNQVQIGHNVTIGEHTAIAGCVAVAGSTHVGTHCIIGGSTSIAGHLTIADRVMLTGVSMVTSSINKPGTYSSGTGLMPNDRWQKSIARLRQLDKLAKRVNELEKQLAKVNRPAE